MSAIAAPADRRFRRALVKPGRRRRSWRGIARALVRYGLAGAVVAYAGYRLAGAAAHARVLQVDRILVHGNQRLSTGEVLAMLSDLRGQSLVWTELDRWRVRLQMLPWVREADLRRSLPSTVDVAIVERRPIGIGRIHGDMYLLDDRGAIIDQYGPQYADLDLPVVDGLSGSPADRGPFVDPRAELATRLLAAVAGAPDIARRLSQIDVADPLDASVILGGDSAVIRLGQDRFIERLRSYLELAPALRERVTDIDSVDLRYDDRVFVRPSGRVSNYSSGADRRQRSHPSQADHGKPNHHSGADRPERGNHQGNPRSGRLGRKGHGT